MARTRISANKIDPSTRPFEIVERKGLGHPDTLSDSLAEYLSVTYSRYTLENFSAVLRHQFDKTAIMCGRSKVSFGGGELLEPIRILVNGRASSRLGSVEIPLRELLEDAVRSFFRERFPMLTVEKDLRILFEVRSGPHTTTGGIFGASADLDAAIHYRFHPRSLSDLPETTRVESNDTSLGCSWGPYTTLERIVLAIEGSLNSPETKKVWSWLGSDIKIMATRTVNSVSMVVAAPVLSFETASASEYFERIDAMSLMIRELFGEVAPDYELEELVINSGDDEKGCKLYMNYTGSSIESGDEGMVGRGNRIGGVIAPFRPYTMEGIAGKNPRYHVGKVYSAAAHDIACRLFERHGISSNVYLINRMAEPLDQPWYSAVETADAGCDQTLVEDTINEVLSDLPSVTSRILAGEYPLF